MCLALFLIMLGHYCVGGFNLFLCLQHQVLARIFGAKLFFLAAAVSCFRCQRQRPLSCSFADIALTSKVATLLR